MSCYVADNQSEGALGRRNIRRAKRKTLSNSVESCPVCDATRVCVCVRLAARGRTAHFRPAPKLMHGSGSRSRFGRSRRVSYVRKNWLYRPRSGHTSHCLCLPGPGSHISHMPAGPSSHTCPCRRCPAHGNPRGARARTANSSRQMPQRQDAGATPQGPFTPHDMLGSWHRPTELRDSRAQRHVIIPSLSLPLFLRLHTGHSLILFHLARPNFVSCTLACALAMMGSRPSYLLASLRSRPWPSSPCPRRGTTASSRRCS